MYIHMLYKDGSYLEVKELQIRHLTYKEHQYIHESIDTCPLKGAFPTVLHQFSLWAWRHNIYMNHDTFPSGQQTSIMISIINPEYYLFKSQYLSSLFSLWAGKLFYTLKSIKHTHILCSNKEELNWDTRQLQSTHHSSDWIYYLQTTPGQNSSLCFWACSRATGLARCPESISVCRMSACLWSDPDGC